MNFWGKIKTALTIIMYGPAREEPQIGKGWKHIRVRPDTHKKLEDKRKELGLKSMDATLKQLLK